VATSSGIAWRIPSESHGEISGIGSLAAYFIKNRYWGKDEINIRAEQGYEIDRPSLLYLKAKTINGDIEVFIGGKSISVAEGIIQI